MSQCPVSTSILRNSTLAAVYCSQAASDDCLALCANPDLSGIGVRAAFYAQSVINALLVVVSPRDSVASAWGGTLLTTALIIAAIVQKVNQNLTLHHATLILNFATLSCISSLAVAPKLPVWNLRPHEYIARKLATHADPKSMTLFTGHVGQILKNEFPLSAQQRVKDAQQKERTFLGLSLLAQVILQWAWGIFLFVSPIYSQPACNNGTHLMLFMHSFVVGDIDAGGKFAVWAVWLLFSLVITLILSINLVYSGSHRAHNLLTRAETIRADDEDEDDASSISKYTIFWVIRHAIGSWGWVWSIPYKTAMFWIDVLWSVLWLVYIISSELQIQSNCIFYGENAIQGFGQITAVLLTCSPLWSLTVALYQYPSLLQRQKRQRRFAISHAASFS